MTEHKFQFQRGNAAKLLAIPLYVMGWLLSWFVPRKATKWVFGSGSGVAEGSLAVALELQRSDQDADIIWLCVTEKEQASARDHGFTAIDRSSWSGLWATLTAKFLIVTHGLGDVNRYGIFGGTVVQLWHGAPLKRLHFDSPVTTRISGPAFLRPLMQRMYQSGAKRVSLFVAGSPTSAERLRSAFRVQPGKVLTLGDPRDDELIRTINDHEVSNDIRRQVLASAGVQEHRGPILLYAPTWRDGESDPGIPTEQELARLQEFLRQRDAVLFLRPHPLSVGDWDALRSDKIYMFTDERDLTPYLAAFDTIITDYSSAAIDFALTDRPVVWFAPDLEQYRDSRGMYEPLEVTAHGRVDQRWDDVITRLDDMYDHETSRRSAVIATQQLKQRFHTLSDGHSASRVLEAVRELTVPYADLVPPAAVFFESFYGKQVACNPLAISQEISARSPEIPQYWSVTSERDRVPEGAHAVLVGSRHYFAARKQAHLLVVNDWLRFGFRRRVGQQVLQTWHGTMLKQLALGRPNVSLRTRIAIHRESRRWSMMLSQNPHSSQQFRSNYAFTGDLIESGYPRNDRLARAVIGDQRHPIHIRAARSALGLAAMPTDRKHMVVTYMPTWRARNLAPSQLLDVQALATRLGDEVTVLVRGHTRAAQQTAVHPRVRDVSNHGDINDVFLASDLIITDYSSVMFDAPVAHLPLIFYVPDFEHYRCSERGFTFDFEADAPGPVVTKYEDLAQLVEKFVAADMNPNWSGEYAERYAAWREKFEPWDDGHAAERVVDALQSRGLLQQG